MSDVWQRALDPTQRTVLGLTLQPLTLGHVFLLSKVDSALLDDTRESSLADIVLAAFICAQPWRESDRDIGRRGFNWFMAWWGWRCRKLSRNPALLAAHAEALDTYLCESLEMPDWRGKGELKSRAAPWWWRMIVVLTTQFGMSKAEAMDTTIAEANLLWLCKSEMEDSVSMTPQGERDLWDVAHERDLERAKN
jgi:hypothetical protein